MASKIYFLVFFTTIIMSIATVPSTKINEDMGEVHTMPQGTNSFDVTSKAGETFTIKIRGNPTTGYSWFLENRDNLDNSAIQALNLNEHGSSRDYITDEHPEGMVGVGGFYYFRFKGLKAGVNATLRFVNKRPWETTAIRSVDVNVNLI